MIVAFYWFALALASASASTASAFSQADVVTYVNGLRAKHAAPPVAYSSSLAAGAQSWAEHLARINGLVHGGGGPEGAGENLAAVYKTATWKTAVDLWYSEGAGYNYAATAFDPARGHFTQLVWRATSSIGLGVASNGSIQFVVMWFAPAGNVQGQFLQNVLAGGPVLQPPPRPSTQKSKNCACVCR